MRPVRLLYLLWVAAAACNEPQLPAFTEMPAPRPADLAQVVAAQAFGARSTEAKLTLSGRRVEIVLPGTFSRVHIEAAPEQVRLDAGELRLEFAASAELEGLGPSTSLQLSWSAEPTALRAASGPGTGAGDARRSSESVRATLLFNQHRSEQSLTLRLRQRPGHATTLSGEMRFDLLPHGLTLSAQPSDGSAANNGTLQPLQSARLSFEMELEPAGATQPAAAQVIAVAEP
jgi:hypothetical protein